ncbi:MAG TPA: PrsW family glutamic-type intramembrane protease [Bryobacteraceae bacterium]|nr:PrsW family glutamic-type intramembrane protease [Bryobacteraceae bacterium]
MNPSDQWFYLEGSQTRGPVSSTQIARMVHSGALHASAQVAQAGWPQWSPASIALAHILEPMESAAAPALETPVYAIKVQCVSGPDAGKAYMIGAAEVSLGRVSGMGQNDPQVAENHVVLSWNHNILQFRTFPGSRLRVAGTEVTEGALSNGQQFQLGASTWQVGNAPIELTNLLGSIASRLNKLTSTEKLEGFSLTQMFSEVFKTRKPGEIEDYFVVGTTKTTPPLEEVQTGWPKPWFFMRVLLFLVAVYLIFSKTIEIFGNPRLIPGLMVMGSLAVPLATCVLLWELNTPRNVSFVQVLMLVCLGGVISLFFTLIANSFSAFGWLGDPAAGIEEEAMKLLAVIVVARNIKHKFMLNGIVFGAAIGCGFAVFETAGYSFYNGYMVGFMGSLLQHTDVLSRTKNIDDLMSVIADLSRGAYARTFSLIESRSYLAPFNHVAWTAIAAGALWRVKGANPFRMKMLIEPSFLRTFSIPVVLHMLWDTDLIQGREAVLRNALLVLLGFIAWYVLFLLVQQGLRQIKDAQLALARSEYTRTQQVLTTSGRFRAGLAVR